MEKLSEKPKFRKNWKNWQEDASRVKDKKAYGKKIDKIFGHRCPECGGERINGSFYHIVGCPDHPGALPGCERELKEIMDAMPEFPTYKCSCCNDTGRVQLAQAKVEYQPCPACRGEVCGMCNKYQNECKCKDWGLR